MNLKDSYLHGTDQIALIRALKWDGGVLKYQSASTSTDWISVGIIPTWNQNTTGKAATAGTADKTKASLTFGSKTFNGSEAKTITLLDLGGAPAVNGGYLPLSGGTMTGTISLPNGTYISNGSTISGYGMLFWDGTNTNVGSTHGNTIIRNSTGDLKHKIGSNEYNILDSNNSSVSLNNSTLSVKINGITQSLTNTWRGIQDNLTSTSTIDSLSAKQGKILNEKFANYLSLTGGTVTGATTFSQAINANILGNATTSDRVNNSLKIQLKGGTTEGTNQFTFDGSSAKTINITLASIGAQPAGSYKTIQTAVDTIGSSSNTLTFINSISQNTNGVITATTGVVRNASTSASGVVSTEAQSFAGAKTFTANIKASAAAGTSNILEGNDLGASLIVKRTDGANWSLITYQNTAGTLGYLGFNANKQPIYRTSSGIDYVLYHSGNNPNTDTKVKLTATDGTATDRYIPFPTTGTSISSGSTYELFYQADFKYNPGTKLLSVPNITLSNKLTASLAEIDSLTLGNLVVQGTSSLGTVTSGTWNGSKITNAYLNNPSISLAGRTITLGDTVTAATIKSDLSLNNVENKSSATIRGELTSSNVTTALGYTPYNSTNPNGYITSSANITGSAAYPTGFNSRSSSISWGTLTTGNGYTYLTNWHTNAGSDISFAEKSGAVSVQIDGKFYQNEGRYVVLDSSHAANNITSTKISNWDTVYNWYSATTDPSTDAKIDKWFEIENFLNGVTNAQTLTGMLMQYVTLNTAQTITGAKTFSQAINADLLGTATQANRLSNAMTLELTGSVTGSVSFDGSGKATLNTTTNHTHSYLPLAGGTITGTLNINRDAAAIHYNTSSGVSQGWLGFSAANTPTVWMADGATKYNLIHSGNIGSQNVNYATSANGIASSGTLDSQEKIDNFITANRFKYATFKTTNSNNVDFVSNDGMILSIPWTSTDYGAQIAFDDTTSGTVKVRGKDSTWGNWYTLLHSGNYNSYAPKRDGTGASGTWGINISGNADTIDGKHASDFVQRIKGTGSVVHYLKSFYNWNGVQITLPLTWTPTQYGMFAFTVRLYHSYKYTDIVISGYNYRTNHWHYPKAEIIGGIDANYKVKFGWFDTDTNKKLWVWIGRSNNTVFSYGGLSIMNVHCGFYDANMYEGWESANVSESELTNVQHSINTLYLPVKSNGDITGNAATATNVAWSGVTNKPNFVNSFGTKTGDITIRGGQTGNGSVNLAMSNNELQASIVGLGSNAYTSTAYLPLAGGNMTGDIKFTNKGIVVVPGNTDQYIWKVYSSSDGSYGFKLQYDGTGSGNDNSLTLIADNQDSEKVRAYSIKQDGTITFAVTPKVGTNNILHLGNSSVTGGGSSWGSSITVNIGGTSKTLTIPDNPNTDSSVQQSETDTSNFRPIVFGLTSSANASSLATFTTGSVFVSTKFYAQPSTGKLYATEFNGNLTGNVTGNISGSSGSCTGNSATATYWKMQTLATSTDLNTMKTSGYYTNISTSSCASFVNGPAGRINGEMWMDIRQTGASSYGSQTYYARAGSSFQIYTRTWSGSTFSDWVQLLHTGNINSYAVVLTGNQTIAGNKIFSGTTSLSIAEIDSLTTGNLVNQGSASLGTITSGIWNASTIAADYLPLGGTDSGTKRWVKKDATTGQLYIDQRNDIQTLPTGNKTYLTYIGAQSSSNNNKSNGATTNGNTYMKIFEDNILKNQYKISGSGSVSVASDANGNITITGTTYTNNISTPNEAISFAAANYNLSSASWTSATSLVSYSGTFAIQIKDTNSTTNKTNYYSGIIMLNGSTGRQAVEEIPLSALMATGSDTEVPTRIYAGIQQGVLKLSSQDASAVAHNITVKILKLIAL